jgi:3-dehydroquinate synthase
MAGDKKAEGGNLTFILVKNIGEAYVAKKVDRTSIREFLVQDGAVVTETV